MQGALRRSKMYQQENGFCKAQSAAAKSISRKTVFARRFAPQQNESAGKQFLQGALRRSKMNQQENKAAMLAQGRYIREMMTIDRENLLNSIIESLDRIQHIDLEDIPNIDLYMDQVTTFMDRKLKHTTRHPEEDKILTKTMINNYAKNDLLPPPVKKKYSKEHMVLLILIYYYKGILSISDIQSILNPLTDKYFQTEGDLNLGAIYEEVFALEEGVVEDLKADIVKKFSTSQETFLQVPEEEKEILQLFSFICMLSYDVYVKKMLIEKMVDSFGYAVAGSDKEKAKGKGTKEKTGKDSDK